MAKFSIADVITSTAEKPPMVVKGVPSTPVAPTENTGEPDPVPAGPEPAAEVTPERGESDTSVSDDELEPQADTQSNGVRESGVKGRRARTALSPREKAAGRTKLTPGSRPVGWVPIQVAVRAGEHRQLKLRAAREGTTMSELVRGGLVRAKPRADRTVVRARVETGFVALQVLVGAQEHRALKIRAIEQDAGLIDLVADTVHALIPPT